MKEGTHGFGGVLVHLGVLDDRRLAALVHHHAHLLARVCLPHHLRDYRALVDSKAYALAQARLNRCPASPSLSEDCLGASLSAHASPHAYLVAAVGIDGEAVADKHRVGHLDQHIVHAEHVEAGDAPTAHVLQHAAAAHGLVDAAVAVRGAGDGACQ